MPSRCLSSGICKCNNCIADVGPRGKDGNSPFHVKAHLARARLEREQATHAQDARTQGPGEDETIEQEETARRVGVECFALTILNEGPDLDSQPP